MEVKRYMAFLDEDNDLVEVVRASDYDKLVDTFKWYWLDLDTARGGGYD